MIVEHRAQGGTVTPRFRVEFTISEALALADLAASLFCDEKDDPVSTAMQKVAREWRIDQEGRLDLETSVPGGGYVTGSTPNPGSEGSPE